MVTKTKNSKSSGSSDASRGGSVKDSAQQIWQAGLGAFTKAQVEGVKAIESLVKDSATMQRKTKSVAEEKLTEATSKVSSMASEISSKASGQWDKLESIFEERVAKALNKLGVPSAKDVNALIARIDALNLTVQQLSKKPQAPTPAKVAKPAAAKKVGATAKKKAPK
ncbi:phasin family protein [Rhodoferax aquaticus]|uniref:Poly granule associated protein n=1 Tax=Rhodoferax aquaticus TaxID=2527691 RepID=A0A515EL78_9BURK|nr:phasin family protein [Rhodoferax aquaticus]QDL53418.1 poly granule associated protein [Rhodoferax aquaticus]